MDIWEIIQISLELPLASTGGETEDDSGVQANHGERPCLRRAEEPWDCALP